MPSILALPAGQTVSGNDVIPIDQFMSSGNTQTNRVSMSMVLTYVEANYSGGGTGGGYQVASQTLVSSVNAADLVGVGQGGANKAVTVANLLNGETIDQGSAASAAADTDRFWVGQGGSYMAAQTLGALWTWIAAHMKGWKQPVIELSNAASPVQLDGSAHDNAIIICSAAVTLTATFGTLGAGFSCDILNLSGGNVTFGSGFQVSDGTATLATGQSAHIMAASYGSSSNVVYAAKAGSTGSVAAPGALGTVTQVSSTSTSVTIGWAAPATGGAPSSYLIQVKLHSAASWTTDSSVSGSATSATVGATTPLSPSTAYDFQVTPVNAAGSGTAGTLLNVSTPASGVNPPNQPTSFGVNGTPTASSIVMQWLAGATDGTHAAATGYTLKVSPHGAGSYVTPSGGVTYGTSGSYVTGTITGLNPSTSYDFEVLASNAGGSSSYIAATSGISTATAAPNSPAAATASATSSTALSVFWTAPSADATHSAATGYAVQYRTDPAGSWSTANVTVTGTTATITGLTASTTYDVQVQATTSAGSSAWVSTASNPTTNAGAVSYTYTVAWGATDMANWPPPSTVAHGASNWTSGGQSGLNFNIPGSASLPVDVFGWVILTQSNSTTPPSTSSANATPSTNFGDQTHTNGVHQGDYGVYCSPPATAGTWYAWAVLTTSLTPGAGTVVGAIGPTPITVT